MAHARGRRPDPPPLETDDVRVVAAGTAAWALALVALLVLRAGEVPRVETWWLVMCGWGTALGLVGVRYCARRHAAIERDRIACDVAGYSGPDMPSQGRRA